MGKIINEKDLFKNIINKSLEIDNMSVLNMIIDSLISAENNITEQEIRSNCRLIEVLIIALSYYPENECLQKLEGI